VEESRTARIRTILLHLAIGLIVFSGIANLALSLPHEPRLLASLGVYYSRLSHQTILLHRALSTISGFYLLYLAYRLSKHLQAAWLLAVVTLSISAVLEIFRFHALLNPMTSLELLILVILVINYRDFQRRLNRLRIWQALRIAALSVTLVLLYTGFGFYLNRHQFQGMATIWDSFRQAVVLLFLMDPASIGAQSPVSLLLARTAMTLNWSSLLFALILILRPLVFDPIQDRIDLSRARELVLRQGQSPIAYLALEKDKKLFFGRQVEGVLAFDVVAEVAICCGDLICADQDASLFLAEFMLFCRRNHYTPVLVNVTDRFMDHYRLAGFKAIKYGEDAMFNLAGYNLAGGRVAKVRAAINHATKAGITVREYRPHEQHRPEIEQAFESITAEWLKTKKSPEMAFMLGGIGLDHPMDRRYFYSMDPDGKILAFMVFLPFLAGQGYLADVTRRRSDAPQGALEKILYEAFMTMKAEGVQWGSLGLAPLYRVREDPQAGLVGRLFDLVYENLNTLYGFKSLQHAKEKYAPTDWVPRYLVFNAPIFTARIAYALVKVQNPHGLVDYLPALLKKGEA